MTKVTKKDWEKAQKWEKEWHGNCVNSFNEEAKQLQYAKLMGLVPTPTHRTPHNFDLQGKSILDIGGGAYSLLLKCTNFKTAVVSDPLMDKFPQWVRDRYRANKIAGMNLSGEEIEDDGSVFDEVWIYNVLEHVLDPHKIIKNAYKISKIIRLYEWLNTPPNIGHPQTLRKGKMDKWLKGEGKITKHPRGNTIATSYSGVFRGKHYEEV